MSRTYKTRPRWVKLNDPTSQTYERHDHLITRWEYTGRMVEAAYQPWWNGEGPKPEPVMYPEKRRWTEVADCDIDKPHRSWRDARRVWGTDEEKRCDKSFIVREACSCCSHRYAKNLFTSAKRASIHTQLRKAVLYNGWTADPNQWYDVDINTAGIGEDWDYWD